MKKAIIKPWFWLGLLIILGASLFLATGSSFMKEWYYVFVWWGFLFFLDGLNFLLKGESLLSRSRLKFLTYAFFSVSWWCLFEVFNLRLNNWSYHGLPEGQIVRWIGYFLAYATVIPALVELSELFSFFLSKRRSTLFKINVPPVFFPALILLGVLCLSLTLLWPQLFFPLVWLAFIFLLEPLNYHWGFTSLLRDFAANDWSRFWSVVLAGLTAGFFWEFWNFWAGSHWEYSLPYLNFSRVFQMPVLGYTGFLPFAWETMAAVWLVEGMIRRASLSKRVRLALISAVICGLLLFDGWVFHLIDTFTLAK